MTTTTTNGKQLKVFLLLVLCLCILPRSFSSELRSVNRESVIIANNEDEEPSTSSLENFNNNNIDATDQNHRRLQVTGNDDPNNVGGPWPECKGMQFEACREWILSNAPGVYIVRINPDEFDYHRIKIFITEEGQVAKVPKRG
mmetsp:Transcript_30005/g.34202  ORF Transcript_30005/g.34202 Transcript_30005/m.34202 type:complete len:143 (-) Transcript_30005:119-547(-)